MNVLLAVVVGILSPLASAEAPAQKGLSNLSERSYTGSAAQMRSRSAADWDGMPDPEPEPESAEEPAPQAPVPAASPTPPVAPPVVSRPPAAPPRAPDPIELGHPRRDFVIGRWGGDPNVKPAGFEEGKGAEEPPDKKPTFGERMSKFLKDTDLPGWLLKIGVAVALYGVVTFSTPVLIAGVGMAFASLVIQAFLG